MKTLLPAATAAVVTLAGCSLVRDDPGEQADLAGEPDRIRHLEVEVGDLERGLPCRVVDRPASGALDELWRADFERGFCHRKAEETRLVLQSRGWTCQPASVDGRTRADQPLDANKASLFHVVAAWRCLPGPAPAVERTVARPPVPAARPGPEANGPAVPGDDPLDEAVARDLSAIGQDVIGNDTTVDKALGDLNADGLEDAAVVLTRETTDRAIPYRMLMAYLRDGTDYNLVDVWILRPPDAGQSGVLDLAIEDGRVQLGDCCGDRTGPTVLVLDGRKLAHADGG